VLEATGHPVLIHLWVGPHEVFHAAVVLGALLHWLFIRRVLLTYSPAIASPAVPSALGSFRVIAAHHLG
jgi:hypothetical protein